MAFSHVLISRPAPEAAELVRLLGDTGLVPVLVPAFDFEPGYAGVEFNRAWPEDKRRLAIFCSPRSVVFGLRQLPAGFLDDAEIAAIGPVTANQLEEAEHTVTIIPEGNFNSESLLGHPALNARPGKALIFSAPGGRQALFAGLQERGWDTEFAHVYRVVPIAPRDDEVRALESANEIVSVWTSGNAIRHLSEALDAYHWKSVTNGTWVVTSERLADLAREYTSGPIFITDGPSNPDIRDCLLRLI